ncbi:MAG: hypothetical protein IPM20_10690 [Gammaproteobacteria bacterium]|nr:hypothetical protein [Gammaproteobacteria bacterium]
MKRTLRILPALLLAGLAACNGSDGNSDPNEDGEAAGDTLNPTAIASEIAPPAGGQLPAELLPPS